MRSDVKNCGVKTAVRENAWYHLMTTDRVWKRGGRGGRGVVRREG